MEQIIVGKVTLNGGMFLKTSFKEVLPDMDERQHPNVSCTAAVHEDLAKAFKAFTPHLALICEEVTNEEFINAMPEEYDATQPTVTEMGETVPAIKAKKNAKAKKKKIERGELDTAFYGAKANEPDESPMDNFLINTVEFKLVNGIQGIILTGQKMLSTGKWMGLGPTPMIKENDHEYQFLSQLFEDAEVLKYEVGEYIINHKYAPPADPELPFGESQEDDGITDIDFEDDELPENSLDL